MRIAICDDERFFIKHLRPFINGYANSHRFEIVINEYESGEALLNADRTFDIIYLDYQMPGIDGLTTAKMLRERNINCTIIFATNYPDFVYESFAVDTFRFLKKPVTEEMIIETLDAYFSKYGDDYPLLLSSDREKINVETKDIVFLEAFGKHCFVHTKRGTFECTKSMADISRMIPRGHFYKINKAYIINFNWIDRYTSGEVIFKNKEKAFISRNYLTAFKVAYKNYSELKKPL